MRCYILDEETDSSLSIGIDSQDSSESQSYYEHDESQHEENVDNCFDNDPLLLDSNIIQNEHGIIIRLLGNNSM